MAPKNNAKAAKGKGKDTSADDAKGKGGKGGAVKGAQSINVRHILVCFLALLFPIPDPLSMVLGAGQILPDSVDRGKRCYIAHSNHV